VARRAGVHPSIVSRLVHRKPVFCSNATKARVWRKLAELTK
jgi:DNA-binding LacI/PurR family transcriptional regulator